MIWSYVRCTPKKSLYLFATLRLCWFKYGNRYQIFIVVLNDHALVIYVIWNNNFFINQFYHILIQNRLIILFIINVIIIRIMISKLWASFFYLVKNNKILSIRFSPFVKINVFVLQICVWAKKPKKSIADISIPTYTLKCIIVESYVGFFFWASTTLNCFTSMYHKITNLSIKHWFLALDQTNEFKSEYLPHTFIFCNIVLWEFFICSSSVQSS